MLWPQWGGVILFKIQGGSGWFGTIIWVRLTEGQVVVGKWFWSIAKLDMQTDCQRVSRHNLEWEYSEFRKRHFHSICLQINIVKVKQALGVAREHKESRIKPDPHVLSCAVGWLGWRSQWECPNSLCPHLPCHHMTRQNLFPAGFMM